MEKNKSQKLILDQADQERCRVVEKPQLSDFFGTNLEYFRLLTEGKGRPFGLFLLVGESKIVEYLKADENSPELLKKLTHILRSGYKDSSLLVQRKDAQKYFSFLDQERKNRIDQINSPSLKSFDGFCSLFLTSCSASQRLQKSTFDQKTVEIVLKAAKEAVDLDTKQIEINFLSLSKAFVEDSSIYDHNAAVAVVSTVLGRLLFKKMRLTKEMQSELFQAGLYHDIGKTCIASHIINKPGKFSPVEFEMMKAHTTLGKSELQYFEEQGYAIPPVCQTVCLEHHEKFGGGGYPAQKKGRKEEDDTNGIHLLSRMVKVADVYSALLTRKIYRPNFLPQDALVFMNEVANEEYDPEIFNEFLYFAIESFNRFCGDFSALVLDYQDASLIVTPKTA